MNELRGAEALVRRLRRERAKQAKARRPANPKATRGRVIDKPYLAWLRRQPCIVGQLVPLAAANCDGPTEAAHVRYARPGEPMTGMQRKPDDRRCLPACRAHHAMQHAGSERLFWSVRGLDPHALADALYARFLKDSQ